MSQRSEFVFLEGGDFKSAEFTTVFTRRTDECFDEVLSVFTPGQIPGRDAGFGVFLLRSGLPQVGEGISLSR